MATVYKKAFFGTEIVPVENANLSVLSSAVLYGLSVYTVFPVCMTKNGPAAFRLSDHYKRLINSARIIGIDTFEQEWTKEKFEKAVRDVIAANAIQSDVFVRVSVHVAAEIPGTRSRGLSTITSMFIYSADPILSQDGICLKTSVWRRVPDVSIPSRAKVNGAYVNSVLGKQDALDSGYDDCIFLDMQGHVCELSAANIFIVRDGVLITPSNSNDILEGISRSTIIEIATKMGMRVEERSIDLTELYIADEVFACGTSAFIAPVLEIDKRDVGSGEVGPITTKLKAAYTAVQHGEDAAYAHFLTTVQ